MRRGIMLRSKLFFSLFGLFFLGYIGSIIILSLLGVSSLFVANISKFLCLLIIPILFMKWNEFVSIFKFASILLIVMNVSILFIELFSETSVLYILLNGFMPVLIILFVILAIMSRERFVYGSRVTIFAVILSLILFVRFNPLATIMVQWIHADLILGTVRISHFFYIIMSIIIYLLNLLMLDAVYEEKLKNWR